MNHLGLDVHSAHFVVAHVNAAGRLCRQYERTTSGENLIDVLAKVRGPKRLIVEECHLAQWVKHVAEPYVDELIVCDPQRNRWIAEDEFANDQSSARKLGKLSQGGFIRPIRHPNDVGAELRPLFLHYYNLSRQGTRFKNMLKATFRQVAMEQFHTGVSGTKSSNRFKRQYEHLLRSGLGRRMARRHVCRSMLSVVRSVWMKGEAYRDNA